MSKLLLFELPEVLARGGLLRDVPMWMVVLFAILGAGRLIQLIWEKSKPSNGVKTALTIVVCSGALFFIGFVQGKREAEEQKRKQWKPLRIENLNFATEGPAG